MEDLNKQLDFIVEVEKLKAIYRQTQVKSDKNRFENSAEHSWHIALTAQVLHQYAHEEVNITRVMSMLLIHDIVEIDAGDLFAFSDDDNHKDQELKEEQAATRIFGLLPDKQMHTFKSLWFEFEKAETSDARFAKAMDRILPLLQNMRDEGGSWVRHKVKKSQVIKRHEYLNGLAPKLWLYACNEIELAVKNGWLIDA